MKFSTLVAEGLSKPSQLYHITFRDNVESIEENGLVRGSRRSTNGVETQQKIYMTSALDSIDNPFPHHDLWWAKEAYVFEVDTAMIQSGRLEADPEYDNGIFWMCSSDVPASAIKNLGRYVFTPLDDGLKRFESVKYIGK